MRSGGEDGAAGHGHPEGVSKRNRQKRERSAAGTSPGKGARDSSSEDLPERGNEEQGLPGARDFSSRGPQERPAAETSGSKKCQQQEPPGARGQGAGTAGSESSQKQGHPGAR